MEDKLFIKSLQNNQNGNTQDILIIGGQSTNNVYVIQITNSNDQIQQNTILTISNNQQPENIPLYVDLLSDQTLWIQYKYSNMFYPISLCLNNPSDCQTCQFKATVDEQSQSKYYQIIQPSLTEIKLEIDIKKADLTTNFFNFDKSQQTQLTLLGPIQSSKSIVTFQSQLQFSQYKSVTISNIIFQFGGTNCGLNFKNVVSISLSSFSLSQSCYSIFAINTSGSSFSLNLSDMDIEQQDFTNSNSLISSQGYNIILDTLTLKGSTLGDKFQIVTQTQGSSIRLLNSFIQNNICTQNWSQGDLTSALFQTSAIIIDKLEISGNLFCNKLIFQGLVLTDQTSHAANFNIIQVLNNKFAAAHPIIFYESSQNPTSFVGDFNLNTIKFQGNTILLISQLKNVFYFQFQNLNPIKATEVDILTESIQFANLINTSNQQLKLEITTLNIQQADFTSSKQFINSNGYNILIDNLTLNGSTLGDQFQIIAQTQGSSITLLNSLIQNNLCTLNWSSGDITSVLFQASQIIVKNQFIMSGNSFCNKLVFQSLQSIDSNSQVADLNNIQVYQNKFLAISPTIFYFTDQRYSATAATSFDLATIQFHDNTIDQKSQLKTAIYFSLHNINTVTALSVDIKQEYSFQFANMTSINTLSFSTFNFIDDASYQLTVPKIIIPSCFQLYEILVANLQDIHFQYKNSYGQPLVLFQNIQTENSQISLKTCSFKNLNLYQPSFSSNASPIQVQSVLKLSLTVDGLIFSSNLLNVNQSSSTQSASALWIENQKGTNTINSSQFLDTYSNSIYNYVYILGDSIQINSCQFQNSSFISQPSLANGKLFLQKGGMINVKTANLNVQQSTFSQATAYKGSFIYVKSISDPTNVSIGSTSFIDGFSFLDGGAFYFDSFGVQLTLSCLQCTFKNLFTLYQNAAIIGFEPQGNFEKASQNQITIDGGSIINMWGVSDNSFIETYDTEIYIKNIQKIDFDNSIIDTSTEPYKQYSSTQKQQSSLINLLDGQATIQNCNLSNFKINNSESTYSLFVMAVNSQITLDTVVIKDSWFYQNAFQITKKSTLTIKNTQIINVKQYVSTSRLLQSLVPTYTPNSQAFSLIEVFDSTLSLTDNSLISKIECVSNCNGIIQINNGQMNVDSSTISLSKSNFGGAIFVNRFQDTNLWNSLILDQNSAQYDGGALYFSVQSSDKFKLTLSSCIISNNKAINGRGGGMYITSPISNFVQQQIILQDTQVIKNSAKVGGGMQTANISPKRKGSTVFSGNKAFYFGSDSFSYPSHLYLTDYQQQNSKVVINQFRSGGILSNLTFEFQNDNNEKILPVSLIDIQSYSINVQIDPDNPNVSKYTIRGDDTIYYSLKTQSFTFKQLIFVGTPGTSVNIQFKSDQIKVLDQASNTFLDNYAFNMQIYFRACESGEEIADYNQLVECVICPKGSYSFHIEPCSSCPEGATCNGGNDVVANAGYWRKLNDSVLVEDCYNLKANCVGGTFGNHICFEGHIGALCEECDTYGEFWGANYSKASDYACTKCDQIKGNLWFVFLMTAWTMISMTLAIKGNIELLKERAAMVLVQKKIKSRRISTVSSHLQKQKTNPEFDFVEDKSPIFIKMLTNYFQIVGVVSQFNISIPTGIFNVPNSVGSPLKSSLNSLDCALLNIGGTIPMVYLRLIFSMFLPLFYFTLFICGITSAFYISKYRSKKKELEKQKDKEKEKNQKKEENIENKNENKLDLNSKKEDNPSTDKEEQGMSQIKHQNIIKENEIQVECSQKDEKTDNTNKINQRKSIMNVEYVKEEEKYPWFILTTSAIFLVIYVQPDMVSQTIALLSCRKIAESSYILAFVAEECYTSQHILFILTLMIPLLIIWVFLLPFLFFKLLQKKFKSEQLDKIDTQLKYGFLYKEYTNASYYWEFVKMAEKLAIILVMNFYSQQIPIKGVIIFIIIAFYGIMSFFAKPYRDKDVNQIDVNSTNTCAITVLLGIFMYDNPYEYLVIIGLLAVLFINLQFIIKIILKILESYLKKLQPMIDTLCEKYPILKKCFKKKQPKKFQKKTKDRLRKIFQKYLDMDDKERKKLFVNVFEQGINDRYVGNQRSRQNSKNMIPSSASYHLAKSTSSDDFIIPPEKDQKDIQIKHQETKNLTSVISLLQRQPTEQTPFNYNPSPQHNFDQHDIEEGQLKQLNLN